MLLQIDAAHDLMSLAHAVMMSSDGLSDVLDDPDLVALVGQRDVRSSARRLIEAANGGGGAGQHLGDRHAAGGLRSIDPIGVGRTNRVNRASKTLANCEVGRVQTLPYQREVSHKQNLTMLRV